MEAGSARVCRSHFVMRKSEASKSKTNLNVIQADRRVSITSTIRHSENQKKLHFESQMTGLVICLFPSSPNSLGQILFCHLLSTGEIPSGNLGVDFDS